MLLPLKVSRALSRALLQSNRKRLARSIVPVKQVLILRMPRNKHSPPTKPQFRLMTLANIHFSLDFCGGIREADLIAPAASHHTHLYSWHGAVSNLCLIFFILFYYGVTFFFFFWLELRKMVKKSRPEWNTQLRCPSRKHTGVINNADDGCLPFQPSRVAFSAEQSCRSRPHLQLPCCDDWKRLLRGITLVLQTGNCVAPNFECILPWFFLFYGKIRHSHLMLLL